MISIDTQRELYVAGLNNRIKELESQLAEAKKTMQEISKLHDYEMIGIEIQQNAYDMACLARQFLSDAAIASIQEGK